MASSIDYDHIPHSCDRARAEQYPAWGTEFVLLYLGLNHARGFTALLRDTLSLRIRRRRAHGATLIRIDPPFNYCAGLRENSTAAPRDGRPGPSPLLNRLAGLGLLRDVFAWPTFVLVALLGLRRRFDAAIGSGPYGALVCWVLRRLGQARCWVYLDRDYEPGLLRPGLRRRLTAWLERFLIRRADVVVSVGRLLAQLRVRQAERPVDLLPNGVDLARFAPARTRTQRGARLIYIGAFEHCPLDTVIRALPQIRRAQPEVHLLLVGGGTDSARLVELARECGVDDALEILGWQPYGALPELLARADIGLANLLTDSYRRYACPLKVLEYMAAGLPVIATADTEGGAMVIDAGAGIAVPVSDPAALAQAVITMLDDSATYERMRTRGLAFAAEHTWARLLAREAELIRAALGAALPSASPLPQVEGRS